MASVHAAARTLLARAADTVPAACSLAESLHLYRRAQQSSIRYVSSSCHCACAHEASRVEASTSSPSPARPAVAPWSNNAPKVQVTRLTRPGVKHAQPPWTPTAQLERRKVYPKRMRHMLSELRHEYSQTLSQTRDETAFPMPKPGQIITVDMVVPENDMRPGNFVGIVLAVRRNGPMTRFTVRNVLKGTGPVERDFLYFSPFLKRLTVHRQQRVRRAKLTYLRKKRDALSTFTV